MKEPLDAYWALGRLALGRFRDAAGRGPAVANHFRGWLVKAYFFPLMFVWLCGGVRNVMGYDFAGASWTNLRVYAFLYDFIFFFDLLFATVGYVVSVRALDTHVRSAEPAMLGWTVALFCYEPFFRGLFEKAYIQYGGNSFESWLADHPYLRQAWGAAVLCLVLVYVLSTIAFGVRFSNLTNRGILTGGPYRFTKHPAYVSKNLSWWLMSVPFLVVDGNVGAAVKRCLGLAMMNFIYFMRARTEERHLSRDPTYVQYALWMNQHGVLRLLNRVPLLRYRARAPD
jgi:protein-S-isoprenylcysteine O-methyltransferase Ste14